MAAGLHRQWAALIVVLLLVSATGCTTSKSFLFGEEVTDDRFEELLAESDAPPARPLVKYGSVEPPRSKKPVESKLAAASEAEAKPTPPPGATPVVSPDAKPVAPKPTPAEAPEQAAPNSAGAADDTKATAEEYSKEDSASQSPPEKEKKPEEPAKPNTSNNPRADDKPAGDAKPPEDAAPADPAGEISSGHAAQPAPREWAAWLRELRARAEDPTLTEAERRAADLRRQVAQLLLPEPSLENTVDPFGDSDFLAPQDRATAAQIRSLQLLLAADRRVAGEAWTTTADSLREATEAFVPLCPLELRNLEFCRAVQGYGVIEPFATRTFRPRQEVLLYVELENFDALSVATGYETEFRAGYRLIDVEGRKLAEQVLPLDKQVSRNRRRDYFIAYRVFMPTELKPGRYRLQLTIDDVKGHKSAVAPIDFDLVSP